MFSVEKLRGKVEIYKDFGDRQEKIGEYYNIVTRGMGITLAAFMMSGPRSTKNPYSIKYAQVGTGVVDYQAQPTTSETRFNFFKLNSALSKASYGRNLRYRISTRNQLIASQEFTATSNLSYTTQQAVFLNIPESRVTIKQDVGIKVTVVIDKNTANGNTLREVGLFSNNINTPENEQSVLVAYKQFAPIEKTNQFSLIFNWTIQAVDAGNLETWETGTATGGGITPDRGNGGTTDPVPSFAYDTSPTNRWFIQINPPIETITPTINFPNAFNAGSFGLVGSPANFGMVDTTTGEVSANPGLAQVGFGSLTVSAQPSSTNYGVQSKRIYYEISNPKVTGDATAEYLGQIAWTVPAGAVLGASTVIHSVVPLSAGDFESAVWGTHDDWLISGTGTAAFNSSGFVAQKHAVVRNASGGVETYEIVFPTTVTTSPGQIQYYDIYSCSDSLPANTLTIPAYIQNNLYFYVKDLSGNQYQGNIWGGATTVSSILKDGPYKRVYRFYTRMLPQSWATTSPTDEKKPFALGLHVYMTIKKDDPIVGLDFRISNGNYDYQGLDSPAGVGTVLQNDNQVLGNFYFADLWFETSTGVSAVSELERYCNLPPVNTYGDVYKYGLVRNFQTIPEWEIANAGAGYLIPIGNTLGDLFPTGNINDPPLQKVLEFNAHCIGKTKKFHRRFRLFPIGNSYVTYDYAKEVGQFGDVAFPAIIRTWHTIPKWGPTKDLAPVIPEDLIGDKSFTQTHFGGAGQGIGADTYNIVRPINSNLDGINGYNVIVDNLYEHFQDTSKYGICRYDETQNNNIGQSYGAIGTRGININNYTAVPQFSNVRYLGAANLSPTDSNIIPYNWMRRTETPFTSYGSKNFDIGGLAQIHLYKGIILNNKYLRLLNAETNFVSDRHFGIYDFSGVPISPGQVMNHYGITSTTTGTVDIYEWGFPGYPSCKIVDGAGRPFLFPKIYAAKKTNSNLCEPFESDLRFNLFRIKPDPILDNNGNINIYTLDNYNLGTACKYAYYSCPINGQEIFNSNIATYRPASLEHASRVFPLMHAITTLTNDEMWKEEFASVAGFYAICLNPYPSSVNMPIPTNAYTFGGTAYSKDFSLSDWYKTLNTDGISGRGTGTLGPYENVRFLAFGIAGPSMYYQIAPDSWRNQNQLLFEYAASALVNSYIKENGLIGGIIFTKLADPEPNDVIDLLAAGNTLSSISANPAKGYWQFNPSGRSYSDNSQADFVNWRDQPGESIINPILKTPTNEPLNLKGGIFGVSSYAVTVMQSHYQVYMMRCLMKSVKEFDAPVASALNHSCSSVARTLFKDAFHIFSGCAGMPELASIFSNYNNSYDGGLYKELNRPNTSTYRNILTRYTQNGNPQGPVDPSKTTAGPPEFLISNSNSWFYPRWKRGTNAAGASNYTVGNTPRFFSGTDFNTFPSRSGFVREDGWPVLALASIITAGDNLSNLTSSNEYLNRTAWYLENYQLISGALDPAWAASDYTTTNYYSYIKIKNQTVGYQNNQGLFYTAPLLAYIQHVLGLNGQ